MNTNARMEALRSSAERTARSLTNDPTLTVVVGAGIAHYDYENHVLHVPEFREDQADPKLVRAFRGTLDHEIAHVNHSDFSVRKPDCVQAVHDLWNAFEDLYVEREHIKQYPGAARNLEGLIEWENARVSLIDRTDPTEQGPVLALALAILSRARDMDGPLHPGITELYDACAEPIQKGVAAVSSQEAYTAAEEVWDLLQSMLEEPEQEAGNTSADSDDESGESEDSEQDDQEEGPEEGEAEGQPQKAAAAGAGQAGSAASQKRTASVSQALRDALGDAISASAEKADPDMKPAAAVELEQEYWEGAAPRYTVHPSVRTQDTLVTFTPADKARLKSRADAFMAGAGSTVSKLVSYMSGAINASRQSLVIGAQEDGEDLDPDALASIALGINGSDIFSTTIRQIEESTYVQVLVDCSGSMGTARPGGREKATHATVTAMALHKALQACRVQHSVIGYTTTYRSRYAEGVDNDMLPNGFLRWSRCYTPVEHHMFVEAPGTHDSGSALAAIDGHRGNCDAESVYYAARYAAQHGGNHDRVILLVIADGLPSAMDDGRMNGPALEQAVQDVARAQIEVYGIGLELGYDGRDFERFYPDHAGDAQRAPTGSIQVEARSGLTDDVLRKLTTLITRGYGMSRKAS